MGSRWLAAYLWEAGPFQEYFDCSDPKMLSLDHTAARSDLDQSWPRGWVQPTALSQRAQLHVSSSASGITFLG